MKPLSDQRARNVFGASAFIVVGYVIHAILSPDVPDSKEAIANVILGNVLGWPAIILSFYFGTSQSSVDKNHVIAGLADAAPKDVHVTNKPSDPVPVETTDA